MCYLQTMLLTSRPPNADLILAGLCFTTRIIIPWIPGVASTTSKGAVSGYSYIRALAMGLVIRDCTGSLLWTLLSSGKKHYVSTT